MWSLTTDIMAKQTIHQCILDQRIPPLTLVLCTAEQVCNVFSKNDKKTVIRVKMRLCAYEIHNTKQTFSLNASRHFVLTLKLH